MLALVGQVLTLETIRKHTTERPPITTTIRQQTSYVALRSRGHSEYGSGWIQDGAQPQLQVLLDRQLHGYDLARYLPPKTSNKTCNKTSNTAQAASKKTPCFIGFFGYDENAAERFARSRKIKPFKRLAHVAEAPGFGPVTDDREAARALSQPSDRCQDHTRRQSGW